MQRILCVACSLLLSATSFAQLNAGFKADVISGCPPLIVNFQDQSTGNPSEWLWNLGNGVVSHQQHPATTYFNPGTYSVSLVIKGSSGTDSILKEQLIVVYANPVVNFSLSDSTGCFPKTIQFNDNTVAGSGNINQWTWDFGDGNISAEENPVHTYTNAGSFHVTLKARNSYGCEKTLSKYNLVTVANTTAAFSFTGSGNCSNTNITFNNQSENAKNYQWNFGDGNYSAALHPTHTYGAAGIYQVKLLAYGVTGCVDTITKTISVGAVANFNTTQACEGMPVSFQNTSLPAPFSSSWNFGDGTTSVDADPVKTFALPGIYHVKLITDFGSCKDSVVKTITIHAKPSAAFTVTGNLLKCSGPSVINYTASSAGLHYQWSFGDGSTSSLGNPVHNYTAAGIYDVQLIATNDNGCSDTVLKTGLVKIIPPSINAINGASYTGCTPYTAQLSADVTATENVAGWLWHFGDGTTSSLPSPSHVYSLPGTYNITLIITTVTGCVDSLTYPAAIKISNKPVIDFEATPRQVCAAAPVQFTNLTNGADEYSWNFGDGAFSTDKNPVHQFRDTGFLSITLIASSTGCSDTLIKKDYIRHDPPIGRYIARQNCDNPYEVSFQDNSLGGQTYHWSFGDGDSSTLKDPVHTYKAAGVYAITFTVFHGTCSYQVTGSVTIVDEHPSITIADTAICRNADAMIAASNINPSNISTYSWDFGDGNIQKTTSMQPGYAYAAVGTYYPALITTDIRGCKDTAREVIKVNVYGPVAKFSNIEGACVGTAVQFKDASVADGKHPIRQWQWNFGDGNTATNDVSSADNIYNTAGSYTVTLRIQDSYGCYDSVSKPGAIIIADPVADFVLNDSVKCSANKISISNQSNGLTLAYKWNFGDGVQSSAENPEHSFQAAGSYNISLTVTDRFGCTQTTAKKQLISDPSALFIASDSFSTCPPLMVNLTNQSTGYSAVSWDFGDGSTADKNNPSHYYTYPGTYQLQLRATGFGNCVDSVAKTIVVQGPTGSFNFDTSNICTHQSVAFTATTKNNAGFLWDFSDGVTLSTSDSTVSHVYDKPGLYQPKLILTNAAGCEVAIASPNTVKVLGVQANMRFQNSLFCDTATIQFSDSSIIHNDDPSVYSWSFGDGDISNLPNPVHTYETPGTYSVSLRITTEAGCTDSVMYSNALKVFTSPEVAIKTREAVCINDTLQFEGLVQRAGEGSLSWNWSFPGGKNSSLRITSESFGSDGNKPVQLVVMNSSGCSDTAIASILVHPLPDVKAGTDTMICRGQTYTLQPTGAATYQWQAGNSISCVDCPAAIVNPLHKTTYYVKGTSQFGCVSNDSVTISVLQPFAMRVNQDDTLCAGKPMQLIANGAAKYKWYPSEGLSNAAISNPVATPSATTNYMVVGTDQLNCFNDTAYIKLSVFPVPQFNIMETVMTLPAGSATTVKTSSSADVTKWKWYPSTNLSCDDCPQPVITAKDNITYQADASNDGGCTTSDRVTVSVVCNGGNVFIPNTFTPNNDGMNDVFYPRGKGITAIKSMRIFSRWGELVYEKNDFSANDFSAGWNGSYKGLSLTPDVFVYIVDVVCDNSTVFTLKGNVTLIR